LPIDIVDYFIKAREGKQ